MKQQQKPTMRELSKRVESLTHRYRLAQIREKMRIAALPEDQQANPPFSQNQMYIESFDLALNCLTPQQRMIIYNDFLTKQFAFWWEMIFARSTYYRKKLEAVQHFCSYFYNL